jgi:hypothetical protein
MGKLQDQMKADLTLKGYSPQTFAGYPCTRGESSCVLPCNQGQINSCSYFESKEL